MVNWTEAQYHEYLARLRSGEVPEEDDKPDEGPESVLQGKIMQWAKQHAYPCQCFRRSRKAKKFLVPGLPD